MDPFVPWSYCLITWKQQSSKQPTEVKWRTTTSTTHQYTVDAIWISIQMFFNEFFLVFSIYLQVCDTADSFYRCRFAMATLLWKRFLKSSSVIELRRSFQSNTISISGSHFQQGLSETVANPLFLITHEIMLSDNGLQTQRPLGQLNGDWIVNQQ